MMCLLLLVMGLLCALYDCGEPSLHCMRGREDGTEYSARISKEKKSWKNLMRSFSHFS